LSDFIYQMQFALASIGADHFSAFVWRFFPFVILFELPIQIGIIVGVLRYTARRALPSTRRAVAYAPAVSFIVTAYGEGALVGLSIRSLLLQRYAGPIEIIAVIDGAAANGATLDAARALGEFAATIPRRSLRVVPKWQRGGRVSTLNAGLALAHGEILFNVDGDTSFDNNMVEVAVRNFRDPNTVAVAGNIRVRNPDDSLVTGLQAMEYMIAIGLGRTGLSTFNTINNVSGAFGIFRTDFLRALGGWNTGTAEDLDLTLRIKQYFGRNPHLRMRFDPRAIGHTEVPNTFGSFFKQRLTWDGDLFHTYMRSHRHAFSPRLVGWANFLALVWTGLLWQLVLPALIFVYTAIGIFAGFKTVSAVLPITYLYYLTVTLIMFGSYVLFVSDRPLEDIRFMLYAPIYPIFGFVSRLWSFIALLRDAFLRSFLDSPMAPYWVLRMGRY
jgi:biofilm PGA synthesis N-glycosyltransferase PgaC